MYRKYMATAAAVLVSVSLMMTGCNGNHAVKDNNIQQSEAVNAKSEDSTRTAAGSRTRQPRKGRTRRPETVPAILMKTPT